MLCLLHTESLAIVERVKSTLAVKIAGKEVLQALTQLLLFTVSKCACWNLLDSGPPLPLSLPRARLHHPS
jgi:hypothetical protein